MGKIKYCRKARRLSFGKMSAMAGMQMITEDGLAQNGRMHSLYYRLECRDAEAGIFRLLRFYDIPFRLLVDTIGHCAYLGICEGYDSMEQAENDLKILEGDIIKNLPRGCALHRLNMHHRLSLLQKMCAGDSSYINTENYQGHGDWVNDVCMRRVLEQPKCLVFGNERKNSYHVCAYKRPENLLDAGQLPEDARYVLLDCGNIPNHAVRLFMEENYLGLKDMERSIEKKPALHEALFGEGKEDTKLYTLVGAYVVQASRDGRFAALPEQAVNGYVGMQKAAFKAFVPSGFAGISQMRVCESSQVHKLTGWMLREGGVLQ